MDLEGPGGRGLASALVAGRPRARPGTWLRGLRARLRSRTLILAEILGIAAAGAVQTAIPQAPLGTSSEASDFAAQYPRLAALAHTLALDRVVESTGFLLLVMLATVTLGLVLEDQWRRTARLWRSPLSAESFVGAPYRRVLERPATGAGPRATFRTRARLGVAGTPLFHTGLMLVVIAGLLHSLFSSSAVADLVEGETLPPSATAYAAQWGGKLSRPFALGAPLVLEHVHPDHYPSGNLRRLSALVSLAGRERALAINAPLTVGAARVYLSSDHGPAALIEHRRADEREVIAVPLRGREGTTAFEGSATLAGGLAVRVRASMGRHGELPPHVDLRALRGSALLTVARLEPGYGIAIAPGEDLVLQGFRYWGQLLGRRDPGLPVAFAGFGLMVVGAAVMFGLTRVDTAVIVAPTPRGEEVLVALKPQRFAALYAERFEALVRDEERRRT